MTGTPGDRMQAELLSDLTVDLRDRLAGPRPPLAAPTAGELTASARTDTRLPAVDTPAPALEVLLTPLHWSSPRLARLPSGTGLLVRAGPVRLSLTLRR